MSLARSAGGPPVAGEAWTNHSVRLLAGDRNPVDAVTAAAREMLLDAVDAGWNPPPYDPLGLADTLGIPYAPVSGGAWDARTVSDDSSPSGIRIEYDPSRPRGRLRFSIAHELAHTLFPDVAEEVRRRTSQGAVAPPEAFAGPDDWQLEMLCNIGAGELLMPVETLADLDIEALDVASLMTRQRQLQVSTEALMRRLVSVTPLPVTMLVARRVSDGRYVVDYSQRSRSGGPEIPRGTRAPDPTVLAACTAVGFYASANESWPDELGPLSVQAVGLPPYPGQRYPRVAALMRTAGSHGGASGAVLRDVAGMLDPSRIGQSMILHVVNDRAHAWAGQFGSRLARSLPDAAAAFRSWTVASPDNLELGNVHAPLTPASGPLVCSLVAQEGYGTSKEARIRYPALARCLDAAADIALSRGLPVYAPRIGTGQAGGHWDIVRDQIDRSLVRHGVDVTIYTPSRR